MIGCKEKEQKRGKADQDTICFHNLGDELQSVASERQMENCKFAFLPVKVAFGEGLHSQNLLKQEPVLRINSIESVLQEGHGKP